MYLVGGQQSRQKKEFALCTFLTAPTPEQIYQISSQFIQKNLRELSQPQEMFAPKFKRNQEKEEKPNAWAVPIPKTAMFLSFICQIIEFSPNIEGLGLEISLVLV